MTLLETLPEIHAHPTTILAHRAVETLILQTLAHGINAAPVEVVAPVKRLAVLTMILLATPLEIPALATTIFNQLVVEITTLRISMPQPNVAPAMEEQTTTWVLLMIPLLSFVRMTTPSLTATVTLAPLGTISIHHPVEPLMMMISLPKTHAAFVVEAHLTPFLPTMLLQPQLDALTMILLETELEIPAQHFMTTIHPLAETGILKMVLSLLMFSAALVVEDYMAPNTRLLNQKFVSLTTPPLIQLETLAFFTISWEETCVKEPSTLLTSPRRPSAALAEVDPMSEIHSNEKLILNLS